MNEKEEGRPTQATHLNNFTTTNPSRRPLINSTRDRKATPEEYPAHRLFLRQEFVHRLRSRRRISAELDRACGISRVDLRKVREILEHRRRPGEDFDRQDYHLPEVPEVPDTRDPWRDSGMSLGWEERSIAGRKLAGLPLLFGIEAA